MSDDNPSSQIEPLAVELAVDDIDEAERHASVDDLTQKYWPAFRTGLQDLWRTERPGREGDVSIVLVGSERITELNRDYRGKDRPTDVLTFDLSDDEESVEGEVYISVPVAIRQAERADVPPMEEYARLMVHGLLHLAGHDHHTPADGRRMARATRRWLAPMTSSHENTEKESRSGG